MPRWDLKKETEGFLETAFQKSVIAGENDIASFACGMHRISQAFSARGNQSGWAMDQNDALDLFDQFKVLPDLVLDSRGEEGLSLAVAMDYYVNGVNTQLLFDQNTLEM